LQEQRAGQQLGNESLEEQRRCVVWRDQQQPKLAGLVERLSVIRSDLLGLADGFRRGLVGRLQLGRRRIGQLQRRGSARIKTSPSKPGLGSPPGGVQRGRKQKGRRHLPAAFCITRQNSTATI